MSTTEQGHRPGGARRVASALALTAGIAAAGVGVGPAQAGQAADRLRVVGIGDSYASGEGAGDYRLFDGGVPQCRKSEHAWIRKVTMPNGLTAEQNDLVHAACSGASAASIVADTGRGAGQLNRLDASTDVVLLSVGGNDAHFGSVMRACLNRQPCLEGDVRDAAGNVLVPGPLKTTMTTHLKTTVRQQLRTALVEMHRRAPQARFVWAGYPDIYTGQIACRTYGGEVRTWLRRWRAQLETVQQEVAAEVRARTGADLTFVPVQPEFAGHGACEGANSWINDLTPTDPQASFHPNRQGQLAYVRALNPVTSADSPRT